jgi:histidine ammonia-lyase
MGTNSALLTKKVIDNAFQVTAVHFMALAQAVDYLKNEEKLSPEIRRIYKEVRAIFPVFVEDAPHHKEIEAIKEYLMNHESIIR